MTPEKTAQTMIPIKMTTQDFEKAWELWNKVQELSQMLWEFYENYFIERCIDEENERQYEIDLEEMDSEYKSFHDHNRKGEKDNGN